MPTFSSFDEENKKVTQEYDLTDKQSKGAFLTKVFGMMFICLLITTAVAAGLGYGFQYLLMSTATNDGGTITLNSDLVMGMLITLIVSAIALLIMSFVLPITFMRGRHNILVPLIIYVVLMGVLLSSFTWLFEPIILVEAFGITALVFGLMALLGFLSKGKIAGIGVIMLGLLLGAGILALINFLMIMFGGISQTNVALSWIVSLAIFAFLMFMTIWDVARINMIAEKGSNSGNNLIYYCAYILYSDFIAILVRVVYYLAIFTRKR